MTIPSTTTAAPLPPIANDDTAWPIAVDTSGDGPNVLRNDVEPQGLPLRLVSVTGAAGMPIALADGRAEVPGIYVTLNFYSDGSTWLLRNEPAAFDLAPGQIVTETFSYTASNGSLTDDAILTFTVRGSSTPGQDLEISQPQTAWRMPGFKSSEGQIYLHERYFRELGHGADDGVPLKSRNFTANADGEATKKVAQIIYDTSDGRLYYDADGKGGDEAEHIAHLMGAPKIRFSDFELI